MDTKVTEIKSVDDQMNRREEFRSKHEKAKTLQEDVMRRYYEIKQNKNKPVLVEGTTIDRVINKYGNNGMAIVSAYKSDMNDEYNDEKTKELISALRKSGFLYLPIYGKDGMKDVYEPSFIVFNCKRGGEQGDFNAFRKLALDVFDKYEQNSMWLKEPDKTPMKDTDSIVGRWSCSIQFNECYVNPMPCQMAERLMRGFGEIMIV